MKLCKRGGGRQKKPSLYRVCFYAIGKMSRSTNDEVGSVGPSHPGIIGLPMGVGLWISVSVLNIGIWGGLGVRESHLTFHQCLTILKQQEQSCDKTAVVKKADKETKAIIMNREDKLDEGQPQQNDRNNYWPLDQKMVGNTTKKIEELIDFHHRVFPGSGMDTILDIEKSVEKSKAKYTISGVFCRVIAVIRQFECH